MVNGASEVMGSMNLESGVVEYSDGGVSPVIGPPVLRLSCGQLTVICSGLQWPLDSGYFLLDSACIFNP